MNSKIFSIFLVLVMLGLAAPGISRAQAAEEYGVTVSLTHPDDATQEKELPPIGWGSTTDPMRGEIAFTTNAGAEETYTVTATISADGTKISVSTSDSPGGAGKVFLCDGCVIGPLPYIVVVDPQYLGTWSSAKVVVTAAGAAPPPPGGGGPQGEWTVKLTVSGVLIDLVAPGYPGDEFPLPTSGNSWQKTWGDPAADHLAFTLEITPADEIKLSGEAKYLGTGYTHTFGKAEIKEGIRIDEGWEESVLGKTVTLAAVKVELIKGAAGFTGKLENPLNADTFQELISNLIDFVWVIALAVAPLMLLIAGFLFLTAGGRAEQLTMARKMIFWTVVGFVIIAVAEGLIAMLRGILGG